MELNPTNVSKCFGFSQEEAETFCEIITEAVSYRRPINWHYIDKEMESRAKERARINNGKEP